MKKVKSLEILFDNTEYVVIPNRYFESFCFEDVRMGVCRVGENAIERNQTAEYAEFVLTRKANDDFCEFETDIDLGLCGVRTLFERISDFRDVYGINLICDDDSSEKFVVKWSEEENVFRNKLQSSKIDGCGNLCVTIGGRNEE